MDENTGDLPPTIDETWDDLTSNRGPDLGITIGGMIGPYRILSVIGEGGFGVVYRAEQVEPVRRFVALKVIKAGMDTRMFVARFEAERQALAMMDHPGIARIYDGGATEQGRPYFVMEYVDGIPLTTYCDRKKLDTKARLQLFLKICDAVLHAHQKGIMHRDLKPGNILVTEGDRGEPQPKVIDFGIAKATEQSLTEKTIFTELGQMIGTPAYMSPEQAEMSASSIDVRTDVYSLGVILYELLSGQTPFDPAMLRRAGFAEMQRIIREEVPPRPSLRLTTTSGTEGMQIAEFRGTKITELQSMLRRELEWVPLKALRKERGERYSSVEAFGADVRRYLAGEALMAGPESGAYRLRKFIRRNKGPVLATALVSLTLVAGIVGTSLFAIEAERQRSAAATQRDLAVTFSRRAAEELERVESVKAFVAKTLSSIDAASASPMDKEVMTRMLQEAVNKAELQFRDQPDISSEILSIANERYEEALPYFQNELDYHRRTFGDDDPRTLDAIYSMGDLHLSQGKTDQALPYYMELLETSIRVRNHFILNELASGALKRIPDQVFLSVADDVLLAARKACEFTNHEHAPYLETLARVHWRRGEAPEAVKWQETAIKQLGDAENDVPCLETLALYRGVQGLTSVPDLRDAVRLNSEPIEN
jgi:serine/threonine protein kinase